MLRYPCLILDHDDTVVQSETTINYPYFCYILDQFRPGQKTTLEEYLCGCFHPGFVGMCREKYGFTDQELREENKGWMEYIRTNIPAPYPGIKQIIHRQKDEGGMLFVVSHSGEENIKRDYMTHFGFLPDAIYGWDLPEHQRKPNTYPLEHIMDVYGFTKDQMLVVDDLKPAWQMANKIGVPIAFAAWSKQAVPQILEEMTALCDFAFDSPKKLEEFLFN